MLNRTETKLRAGSNLVSASIWSEGQRFFFSFKYNKPLMAEVKSMQGAKWHGFDEANPRKLWSIADSIRNRFQIGYLSNGDLFGPNPYLEYDSPLDTSVVPLERFNKSKQRVMPLLSHQPKMTAHMLQRHGCIVAAEMGTSKTLSCIIAMELATRRFESQPPLWYVAPRSALKAVEREFKIWGCLLHVEFMTYEGLVKRMKEWIPGAKAPFWVTFDESSKLKNFQSQRSQAAFQLAEGVRADWNGAGHVVLMSGSPAPKSPMDWWSQAEIACPGYLKEGDIYKFKNRLAIIIKKESEVSGGVYPELVTWKDSASKCDVCGLDSGESIHKVDATLDGMVDTGNFSPHTFVPSINEVAYLHKRLSGLTIVFFKRDCLDLPDKNYRIIEIKPSGSILRAAKLLLKSSPTVIEGLTRVRELSDGFQYNDEEDGDQVCPTCNGSKVILDYSLTDETGKIIPAEQACPQCQNGRVKKFKRSITMVECPKDAVIRDLLDEYESVGRVVIFGGFTGTIDRCVNVCLKEGWAVIRLDQGKEQIYDDTGRSIKIDYIDMFQDKLIEYPRVAFVAHPKSGGMGLTLTASPMITYYSNDFDAEARIQSEDRIHRTGMDLNRGATIIDIIHLSTDRKVMENLKMKRNLQDMTLGEFDFEESHGTDAI